MGEKIILHKKKFTIKIITTILLLSTFLIVATTPIHEATHWVLSEIDPYVEPEEIHIFKIPSHKQEKNILFSPLGSVIITEKYPGAFDDRPEWADLLQEIICVTIQMIITIYVVLKTIEYLLQRKQNKKPMSSII